VENLEELVNAAESFVMQEGFGRDAVALAAGRNRAPLLTPEPGQPGAGPVSRPVLRTMPAGARAPTPAKP
jgi:DNA helicase II / ATP-dependent DNA helicase PcrA